MINTNNNFEKCIKQMLLDVYDIEKSDEKRLVKLLLTSFTEKGIYKWVLDWARDIETELDYLIRIEEIKIPKKALQKAMFVRRSLELACYGEDGGDKYKIGGRDKNIKPYTCSNCGNTKVKSGVMETINGITAEQSIRCINCDQEVDYWAYGYYKNEADV